MSNVQAKETRAVGGKFFKAKDGARLLYQGKKVAGITLAFYWQYFVRPKMLEADEKDIEIFFPSNRSIQPQCFYECSYEKDFGYQMECKTRLFDESLYSRVAYKPKNAYIWLSGVQEPHIVPFEDAVKLLIANKGVFRILENLPAKDVEVSV